MLVELEGKLDMAPEFKKQYSDAFGDCEQGGIIEEVLSNCQLSNAVLQLRLNQFVLLLQLFTMAFI